MMRTTRYRACPQTPSPRRKANPPRSLDATPSKHALETRNHAFGAALPYPLLRSGSIKRGAALKPRTPKTSLPTVALLKLRDVSGPAPSHDVKLNFEGDRRDASRATFTRDGTAALY